MIVGSETVAADLPIAFNDPSGTYGLIVTTLFTQKTVTRNWKVQ